jgi:hypothetical protein
LWRSFAGASVGVFFGVKEKRTGKSACPTGRPHAI